jgi:DNA polymerase alpha-associated DNA helicase A
MHAIIADFPSRILYNYALISHDSVAAHLLKDLPGVTDDSDTISDVLELPIVFFDTAGCEYFERLQDDADEGGRRLIQDEGSRCNENEATVVKTWIEKLVSLHVFSVTPSSKLNFCPRSGSCGSTAVADSCNNSVRAVRHAFDTNLTSQSYQAQVALLSTMLKPTMAELEIGTVDGMQGILLITQVLTQLMAL